MCLCRLQALPCRVIAVAVAAAVAVIGDVVVLLLVEHPPKALYGRSTCGIAFHL